MICRFIRIITKNFKKNPITLKQYNQTFIRKSMNPNVVAFRNDCQKFPEKCERVFLNIKPFDNVALHFMLLATAVSKYQMILIVESSSSHNKRSNAGSLFFCLQIPNYNISIHPTIAWWQPNNLDSLSRTHHKFNRHPDKNYPYLTTHHLASVDGDAKTAS